MGDTLPDLFDAARTAVDREWRRGAPWHRSGQAERELLTALAGIGPDGTGSPVVDSIRARLAYADAVIKLGRPIGGRARRDALGTIVTFDPMAVGGEVSRG